jgi:hypothetical protein
MTRQTLYRNLRKTINKYTWEIFCGRIRGKNKTTGEVFCPITAIYYEKHGKRIALDHYREAGLSLGLNDENILTIAQSSDNSCLQSNFQPIVRKTLERILLSKGA